MAKNHPLRSMRIIRGMTQIELAKAAGLSQQLMSKLENGSIRIGTERAQELATILECKAADLLPALAETSQPWTETAQELELLTAFRLLSDVNRKVIMQMAHTLRSLPVAS